MCALLSPTVAPSPWQLNRICSVLVLWPIPRKASGLQCSLFVGWVIASSPVPYLSRSCKQRGVAPSSARSNGTCGTRSSLTEIPNGNFPKIFVNGKRPIKHSFLEIEDIL